MADLTQKLAKMLGINLGLIHARQVPCPTDQHKFRPRYQIERFAHQIGRGGPVIGPGDHKAGQGERSRGGVEIRPRDGMGGPYPALGIGRLQSGADAGHGGMKECPKGLVVRLTKGTGDQRAKVPFRVINWQDGTLKTSVDWAESWGIP